ncbi:MAG: glycerophosphodiester phosphodiesterase family protein [Prolixibacteraceae bacterium]
MNMRKIICLAVFVQFSLFSFHAVAFDKERGHYMSPRSAKELREMFRYTGDSVAFLSSHRGGPDADLPENCTATFANTLKHTYSIMEIDPRYTKDSVMIVHHDPTLQRTTTGTGRVSDYTLEELRKLKLKDMKGVPTAYGIQTLAEVLEWARGKTILVLDKKDVPIEARIKMVEACKAEAYTIVMAYSFEEAKLAHQLNENIMMQVFISNPDKVEEFDHTGVPWENIVAFVGHKVPEDPTVFKLIHEKGALCILGTSRNLDREFITGKVTEMEELTDGYHALFRLGADILETDIPVPVSNVVTGRLSSKTYRKKFLQ